MRNHIFNSLFSYILVIICVFSVAFPVQVNAKTPSLEIIADSIPEGKAGQTVTIPITLRNTSNFLAKQVTIKPVLEDKLFIIEELNSKKTIDIISAKKAADPVEFKIKVDRNTKKGTYPIKFEITYKNSDQQQFTQTEIAYVNVTSEHIPVELIVDNVEYSVEKPIAGQEFEMTIYLKNTGTLTAENVIATLKPNENFVIMDNASEQYLLNVPGMTSKKVKYKVVAKEDLESGSYPIDFDVKYVNNFEESQTKESDIYISVVGSGDTSLANVVAENIVIPNKVEVEKDFKLSFDIVNSGKGTASDVKVTVTPDNENVIPITVSKQLLGDLEAGKKVNLSYTLRGLDDLTTKNYPIKIEVSYTEGKGDTKKEIVQEQYTGILIENHKAASGTVPLMIIDKYEISPTIVKAGENYTLDLLLWNTSSEKAVQNMKVTLKVIESSEKTNDDVFSPVDGSNTIYIPYLAPGEKANKQLTMYTIPDAKAKTYKIEAVFEYEYEQNGEIQKNTASDILGVPVVQPAELDVADIQAPMGAMVGESTELEVQFFNTGKVALTNLKVQVETEAMTQNGTYYVGNFESGQSDWFYPEIYPEQAGELTGKVIFTYEDPTGEPQIIEREFSFFAEEAFDPGEFDEMMPDTLPPEGMENAEKGSKLPIIIGGVVGLIAVVVIIIIIVKKKKKKGMNLDEDF